MLYRPDNLIVAGARVKNHVSKREALSVSQSFTVTESMGKLPRVNVFERSSIKPPGRSKVSLAATTSRRLQLRTVKC